MAENFSLESEFSPSGDQPAAIDNLVSGLEAGEAWQTLLGVTGSGKTFTIANVIQKVQRPAIIMAPITTTTSPRPTYRPQTRLSKKMPR